MKLVKHIIVIQILLFTSLGHAEPKVVDIGLYEARIDSMVENGVISSSAGKKQLLSLKTKQQTNFKNIIRNTANKFKKVRRMNFENEPLLVNPAE